MNLNTRRIIMALAAAMVLLVLSLGIVYAFAIIVDGNPADWGATAAVAIDPDEPLVIQQGADVQNVYATTDATRIFWRFDTFGNTTWTTGLANHWAFICMDTDNNVATGVSGGSNCLGMTGIDYIIRLDGTTPTPSLLQCVASCSVVGGATLQAATQNNVTEVSALLSQIGNPGGGCSVPVTIHASVYFDGTDDDPDDHVLDDTDFAVTIPCPTAVTLSDIAARAETNNLPVLPIAALGLVAVVGVVVVTLRRK